MKISIIMVVKNGMPFMADAIKSFQLQDYKKKELIIVYGKSSDDTEIFLKRIKKKYKIFKEKKNNRYDAINYGIKKSTGNIVGLLHSDDIFFYKNTLSKIFNFVKKHNCDAVYGGVYFSDRFNLKNIKRIWVSNESNQSILKNPFKIPHTTLFLKKKIFKEIGFYKTKYKIASDYEFIMRLISNKNLDIRSTNLIHTIMRWGGDSTNLRFSLKKLIEDFTIAKKYRLNATNILQKKIYKLSQIFKKKIIKNKYLNEFNKI